MSLYAVLSGRDFQPLINLPSDVEIDVQDMEADIEGGSATATLRVTGSPQSLWKCFDYLRYGVEIHSTEANKQWWGFVAEIELVTGAWTLGLSLDTMRNRIKIVYNEPTLFGKSGKQETAWLQDDLSVGQYGYKELIQSVSDIRASDATVLQASALALKKFPTIQRRLTYSQNVSMTMRCRGWWDTLGWRYYSQAIGLDEYTATVTAATQKIGLGLTANNIGFLKANKTVHDLYARLGNFKKDDKIRITGTMNGNDGTYTVSQSSNRTQKLYTATTLSFASSDKSISDSAKLLQDFNANDLIFVSGSVPANNGYYFVVSASADGSKIILNRSVTTAGAGASVTLMRGHAITVNEIVANDETPANAVTIQLYGDAVAQAIYPTSVYRIGSLGMRIQKIGNPTDAVAVSLWSNNAGVPFAQLISATINGADIPSSQQWLTASFANPTLMTIVGTPYHLVIQRTGAQSPTDYYAVSIDESLGYTSGGMILRVNGAWNTSYQRTPNADLNFKLIGVEDSLIQVATIVAQSGQFLNGVQNSAGSGVWTPIYRSEAKPADDEIAKLLALGTSTGARVQASVSPERTVMIAPEPDSGTSKPVLINEQGEILDYYGNPMSDDEIPVGTWCEQHIAPSMTGTIGAVTTAFITRHGIRDGKRSIQFRGQRDPFKRGIENE